ncbi:AMP-binding protein [Elizabethkingia anophelis]|uniref:AMP-binding protein n=1 Tax=Elizabethkingia TaxID=308865 RepID=UPI001A32E9F7|nr:MULTISPECIES: AMP-binding protein [Elizabethkingia]MCT3670051.1 AMP-binding protein [Elizabethkingia anophelis]MCT3689460.1 AMP-binding protein [Elizabethkingia anophelis]MCT3706450.1 AMP-binding protein [Elizabethkingia anophelis]MCT3713469.1 AMP-binding protein [Elizabethkingia anophelis]MCT3716888.1 AMP-binding protein [Elizabethkingia anophelis]
MLIKAIQNNKNLTFHDLKSGVSKKIGDFYLQSYLFDEIKKSLVVLYLDNSLESIEIYLKFLNSKHAIALLNKNLEASLKQDIEESYLPQFIYDVVRDEIQGYSRIKEMSGIFRKNEISNAIINPSIKVLLSTSGTTGSPKFVKLSEDNIYQNALSIVDYLPINSKDKCPLNLPIYYSYGLSVLNSNMINGGDIYCNVKDVMNKEFWNDFNNIGFTSLAGVPYVYEMLNRIGFTKNKYPTLKYYTQAGGKLNEKLADIFTNYAIQNKVDFFIMYGQTEATARMSYLYANQEQSKLNSVGKAIKNGRFYIDDENSELIYNGPNVFGGYAEYLNDLQSYDNIDILRTGDIADIDENNYVYITGRLKRFVKILGNRINLDEIEQSIKENFSEHIFYVTGKADQFLVISTISQDVDKTIISSFLNKKFGIHPAYIRYNFVEEFPLTTNGKIDYKKLSN